MRRGTDVMLFLPYAVLGLRRYESTIFRSDEKYVMGNWRLGDEHMNLTSELGLLRYQQSDGCTPGETRNSAL